MRTVKKQMKNKRCLILGGTGFIGINLYLALKNSGYSVSVYSDYKLKYGELPLPNGIQEGDYIGGNFGNENEWEDILSDVDIIFHLISTTNASNKRMLYEFESNVMPSVRLFDACVGKKIKIIYVSSGGTVYGESRYVPIDEGHRTEPISPYGIQKLTIEKCLEYYGRTYGIDYLILRPSNPFGPGQRVTSNQGAIAVFLANALSEKDIEVWGNGSVVRDYIFIDDLIYAMLLLARYDGIYRVFNIGSGKGYSLNEVIQVIRIVTGKLVRVRYLESRIQDVPANVLDSRMLTFETGWSPSVSLEDGIKKMMATWNSEGKYFSYIDVM